MNSKFNLARFHFTTGPLLEGLKKEHFRELKENMQRKTEKKGKIIYKLNTYSKGVYVLRKGKVKIYQINKNGKQQIVYIYKRGEFFGYRPLLCNEPHSVTAEALDDVVMSFIPATAFLTVLSQSRELSAKLLFHLSHEFSVWVNLSTVFAQQPVKARVGLVLLLLKEKFRKSPHDNPDINLRREDIANYVGTVVETLVRILKELKEKNLIEVKGRKIKVIDDALLLKQMDLH